MSIETEFQSTIQNVQNAYNGLNNLGATIPQNKNIENISSCLDEIYNNLPKTEYKEGTEINLGKTIKGKLDYENGVVGIGQCSQDSTQGYQLWGGFSPYSTYGNKFTTNTDGSIEVSLNNTTGNSATTSLAITNNLIKTLPIGTYTFSARNLVENLVCEIVKRTPDTTSGSVFKSLHYNDNPITFTTTEEIEYFIRLNVSTAITFVGTAYPMLETGTTAHEWEKYTNGASPNPSYSQEIKGVRGKNIFNKATITENYRLTQAGELYSDDTCFTSSFIPVQQYTTYTKNSPSVDAYHRICFYQTNAVSGFISYTSNNTFTTPSNCTYVRFCGLLTEKDATMLEEGSVETSYLPYNTIEEVVSGKNWLKGSQDFSLENNGGSTSGAVLTGEAYNNCAIRYYDTSEVEATTFKNFVIYSNIQTNLNIKLKAGGIYTLSFWAKGEANNNFVVYFNGNTNYIRNKILDTNGIRVASTGPNDNYDTDGAARFNSVITTEWQRFYIVWQLNPNASSDILSIAKHILFRQYGGDKIYICGIMFEEGQTLGNNYEPYIAPTTYPISLGNLEFRSIGNYKDEIITDRSTKKWYKYNKIQKVTFNGTENWTKSSNTSLDRYILGQNLDGIVNQGGYCNYFKVATINVPTEIGYVSNNNNEQFIVNYSEYNQSTLESFKTWLTTHNLDYYFVKNTPTQTEITDATLISQLNAWYNAHSNNGSTIITSNGDLPLVIKVRGLKGE